MAATLKQQYSNHVAKLEKANIPLTSYACPADRCGFIIKTVIPVGQEFYDSMTECPDCGCMHFKIVYRDGSVETEMLHGGVA